MTTVDYSKDVSLLAHLLRRASFGPTPDEMDYAIKVGYDNILKELLNPKEPDLVPHDMIRRYHVAQSDLRNQGAAYWIYRMLMTKSPLREKMTLFWHRIFATGWAKLIQHRPILNQIDMFRTHGMGKFDDLLIELSKDPSMIMWLDNQDNHGHNINENYGREILELFSMGVGNYTEDDIKETARAFTGWRVVNPEYMSIKMRNNTARPYGYMSWQFEYDDEDHDKGLKTILGQTGNWNGEDAVRIICEQEGTAKYLARHLYHYFVEDELPVPQWPHEPPKNPEAIDLMVQSYFDNDHNIKAVLETMFTADFFKDIPARYARIKSPAEMVVGALRLAGPIELPSMDLLAAEDACTNMGQALLNPPSVEGWQGGTEWVSTGAYVQRVNFVSKVLSDPNKIGLRNIIDKIKEKSSSSTLTHMQLVDFCLDILGPLDVMDSTKSGLNKYISRYPDLSWSDKSGSDSFDEAVVSLIQLIVSSIEYQNA